MNPLPKVDVVVIGLGAAGGIAAYVLAEAGLKVVGLEAGPYLTADDFVPKMDEMAMNLNWTGAPKFNKEIPTWRPDAASPIQPPFFSVPMANMVGGTSVHYGTQNWRYRADDFTIRTDTLNTYGEEALPEGTTIQDWPITYDDLEPYYDLVEYAVGVSGEAGANPFESHRSRPFPMPPLRQTGYTEKVWAGMESLGYHPFPQPSAVNSVDYDGRPACSYCGFCSPTGCWNDSKGSTLVTTIRKAEETGNLEVRPNSRVMRILSNDMGQTTGVLYIDADGNEIEQRAGVVILSAYIYENVRMLLLSTSDYFPNGLANNNGQVGKNYMSKVYVGRNGLFEGENLNLWAGHAGQAVAMDDLNGDHFDHTGLGFIRGAVIFAGTGQLPIGRAGTLAPSAPQWGSGYKRWLRDHGGSVGNIFAQVEPLPYEQNFLDLDPNVTDPLGVPVLRVTYSLGLNELAAAVYIDERLDEILRASGASETWSSLPPGLPVPVNSHAYGGTCMGSDDTIAVVDQYGLAYESRNLVVLGGSTFPGSAGYNPTETIEALAWYSAEYIAENFNDIAV